MRKYRTAVPIPAVVLCAGLAALITGCTTSLVNQPEPDTDRTAEVFEAARAQLQIPTPAQRTTEDPLVMVHYMPWFEAPPVSGGYGFHWHMGGAVYDPYETLADGRADIASHYYPLTGPYDSSDTDVLAYQVSLMKIAGIDGVIFDWYGIVDALDYRSIHESTLAMIEVIEEAGLKFAVCYEDQSVEHMISAGAVERNSAIEAGRDVMAFMAEHWFTSPAYLRFDGRPVLLTFGPQFFLDPRNWDTLFEGIDPEPYFITLDGHSESAADGSYNWMPMWASSAGTLSVPRMVTYLNEFYRLQSPRPHLVATAWPAFHDIYREAGNGTGYGFLDYHDGETFRFTFEAALAARPDVIQIATWNDFGEGTNIEPTIERGYRELEFLLEHTSDLDPAHPFTRNDLRIPLELYRLTTQEEADADRAAAAREAFAALFAADMVGFRTAVSRAGVRVPSELNPILRDASDGRNGQATSTASSANQPAYDPQGKRNLALGRPATASSRIYDFIATNAVDGQTATYWEGGADSYPNHLTIDLGSTVAIEAIVIKLNPARIWSARDMEIEVLTSTDGAEFTTVVPSASYRFDPIANGNSVSAVVPMEGRYIRITVTANSEARAGQVAELEIYGE